MNWQLLLPLLLTTILATLGWYVVHYLQSTRDRANKKRDLVTSHLLDAYTNLGITLARARVDGRFTDPREDFAKALITIQVLGSPEQIETTHRFMDALIELGKNGKGDLPVAPLVLKPA